MPIDFAPTQTFFFGTFPMVRNPNKISPIHEKGKKKKKKQPEIGVFNIQQFTAFSHCAIEVKDNKKKYTRRVDFR